MNDVEIEYNLNELDKISNSIYFLSGNKYHFNNSFDWQNKKYNCVLMTGKKPVCGILSGDFEKVKRWEDRKLKKMECIWNYNLLQRKNEKTT